MADFTAEQTHAIVDAVIEKFRGIPEVQEIYQEIDGDTLVYWVFSSEEKYDDALLDRMIEQEGGGHGCFSAHPF